MALKDAQQGLFDSEIERLWTEEGRRVRSYAFSTPALLDPFAAGRTPGGFNRRSGRRPFRRVLPG